MNDVPVRACEFKGMKHIVWSAYDLTSVYVLSFAVMLFLNNVGGSVVGRLQSNSGEPTAAPAQTEIRFQVLKIECTFFCNFYVFCKFFVIFCQFVFVSKITCKFVFAKNV